MHGRGWCERKVVQASEFRTQHRWFKPCHCHYVVSSIGNNNNADMWYFFLFLQTFDLKGSMRSRYVQTSGMKNDVLLDENLLESE